MTGRDKPGNTSGRTPADTPGAPDLKGLERRSRNRRGGSRRKSDDDLSPEQAAAQARIALLENSFAMLRGRAPQLVARFYDRLFALYPALRSMFAGTDMTDRHNRTLAELNSVVGSLRKPRVLKNTLVQMGRRHARYGAETAHYGAVTGTLLAVMAEFAGDGWTADTESAWTETLQQVVDVMIAAGNQEKDLPTGKHALLQQADGSTRMEPGRLRSAIDGAMTAIVLVDRDFRVTYMNRSTETLLSRHEPLLAEIFPGFRVANLPGSCTDMFHRLPEHQRRLLADPTNLPYRAELAVGPLTFILNVTAIRDEDGRYVGNTLECSEVTEARSRWSVGVS
jgi:methyl-accepting chemotaxis protein